MVTVNVIWLVFTTRGFGSMQKKIPGGRRFLWVKKGGNGGEKGKKKLLKK